jgi:hypothetical protein
MKNPKYKPNGVINVCCGWVLGKYGALLLKYKFDGDFSKMEKYYNINYHPNTKFDYKKVDTDNMRHTKFWSFKKDGIDER